jgi:hypothetical protein
MSGASAKLIGRRPRDYLECLPKSRKVRVIGRIRRAYLRHFPPLAEDCAQEACARLIASVSELKTAPIQTGAPNGDWYDQVEEALVRYAAGSVMRRAVVKELCAGRGLETLDGLAAQADDDTDDDLVPPARRLLRIAPRASSNGPRIDGTGRGPLPCCASSWRSSPT